MRATPLLPFLVLLAGVLLGGRAVAEYPFDPMLEPAYHGTVDGPGFAGGYPPDGEYGPDPHLYDEAVYDEALYGDLYSPIDGPFGDDLAIWPGWVSATWRPGSERSLGSGEWFQPLYQDGRTLWYFDFRGQGDSLGGSEFNVGTGLRILNEPGWIFGAYAFWDHLNSQHGNDFNQGMIGIEAMDEYWDARLNVYFPESGGQRVGAPRVRVSRGNLVVQTGLERAYWGFDIEGGNLLWAWGHNAEHELRSFYGLYHFDHSANATQSITGPRGRLEWRWYDLFGPGSRLTFGLTIQNDRIRDGQISGFIRLRLPLDPWMQRRQPLSPLHRRMLDRVVRDVDVVTAVSNLTESAINSHTGREINGFQRIDASTQNVGDILDGLDDGSVVVIDGSAGDVLLPKSFPLRPGQLIMGGGSSIDVRGERSGLRATFTAAGARPTVQFDPDSGLSWKATDAAGSQLVHKPPIDGFVMNDHTQLLGVDVTHSKSAAVVKHTSDVWIQDVEVTDFYGPGIGVLHSDHVKLDDVRIRDAKDYDPHAFGVTSAPGLPAAVMAPPHPDADPLGVGILVADSRDIRIDNSSVRHVWADGIRVVHSHDIAIQRTEIKHIDRDAVRLLHTQNVLLADLEIKNAGKLHHFEFYDENVGDTYRLISAISLHDTLNTHIRDSFIHGSKGVGILGELADATLIERLEITDVAHGIKFFNSRDLGIFHTLIDVPNEPYQQAYPNGPPQGDFFAAVDGWIPDHTGIVLRNVIGDVAVRHSVIRGGNAGSGILFSADLNQTTNLWVTDNVIQKHVEGSSLDIESLDGHQLNAWIRRNDLLTDDYSFRLLASEASPAAIVFTHNNLNGRFFAGVAGGVMDLNVTDNHLGGDPMGSIRVSDGGTMELEYRRNTSEPGADVIRFRNMGGTFNAVGGANDHTPELQGNVNVTIDENGGATGPIQSGSGSN